MEAFLLILATHPKRNHTNMEIASRLYKTRENQENKKKQ